MALLSFFNTAPFRDRDPLEARAYRLSVEGPEHLLAPNFALWEFACRCGDVSPPAFVYGGRRYADRVLVHPAVPMMLQMARDHFSQELGRDTPMAVTSGHRTREHNARTEGAAENSTHTTGLGVDVAMPGVPNGRLASYFRDVLSAGGVGLYGSHVHVSVGREGVSAADRGWIAGGPSGDSFPNLFPGAEPPALVASNTGGGSPGGGTVNCLVPPCPNDTPPGGPSGFPSAWLPDVTVTAQGPRLAGFHPLTAVVFVGAALGLLAGTLRPTA